MARAWTRELAGWLLAAAIAVITTAAVASSSRAELLFRDGDSLVVALLVRSLHGGEALDWAMSSVLFLPESVTFAALDSMLPVGVNGLFAVSAVVNLMALYGAIRLAAGAGREGMAPVAWSVAALGAFGALAMTETSPSRDALELASLQLTTTYYSATVVAVVLTVGLVRRLFEGERHRTALHVAVGLVAAVSTLSNPLYAVWATVPLGVLLLAIAMRSRRRTGLLLTLLVLAAGTAVGFLGRIPFAAWIANTGAGYADPALWRESLGYYAGLLGDRLQDPLGATGMLVTLGLLVLAVVRSVRTTDLATRLVATAAWAMPLIVIVGAIALGTHAARYLQPIAFAPVLALVASPRILGVPGAFRRPAAAALGVLLVVGAGVSIPRAASAAAEPDPDLRCVVDWVDASGRTGAGQFWTVRLPKLHLTDPARLVQVDHRLDAYAWLVDRADFDAGAVSFLIEDAQTVGWDLPTAVSPDAVVDCGRYSILDFGDESLPLGPAHS